MRTNVGHVLHQGLPQSELKRLPLVYWISLHLPGYRLSSV